MTIKDLNQRFAIVSVGNKVVVMEVEPDGVVREFWPFEEFRRLLIKEQVKVRSTTATGRPKDTVVPLADTWLKHREGRRYERFKYAMPGSLETCGPDDYNGWLGFTVPPAEGDWSRNRAHLRDVICKGDEAAFAWTFNWCAQVVQKPGQHGMTAIVLRGGQGWGKGHFADRMLGALFSRQQYLHLQSPGQLTGTFNEHLSGKALIFADESTWGGDPKAADRLKALVTEDTIPIERKFLKLVEEPSALHIIIASNHEWPVMIPVDDRRFTVLDVSDARRQDDGYFGALRAELQNGGLAAMLHDLLAHEVDWVKTRKPLATAAKRDVAKRSMKDIERWWFEKLTTGVLLPQGDPSAGVDLHKVRVTSHWPDQIMKAALHEDYVTFLDKHERGGRKTRATQTELGMFLQKQGVVVARERMLALNNGHEPVYFWALKSLMESRAAWLKANGWPEDHDWECD